MPVNYTKRPNIVVLASAIDWWSNWISVIGVLKRMLIGTAATALALGEAVVDPENALLGHYGKDYVSKQLLRYPGGRCFSRWFGLHAKSPRSSGSLDLIF